MSDGGTWVLTGYNTDIEHAGTIYHVQTEDKGTGNPYLESLVYANGEILYSRRTPYGEIVDHGGDRKALATLMDRQHRTIVEAIRRGMLRQLMDRGELPEPVLAAAAAPAPAPAVAATEERSLDEVILDYLEAQKEQAHLVLRSSGDADFVYGHRVRVEVTALNSRDDTAQAGVRVTMLFKSTAEPRRQVLAEGATDEQGVFTAEADLPSFNGGTSAVVIAAESALGRAEVKHLVHR